VPLVGWANETVRRRVKHPLVLPHSMPKIQEVEGRTYRSLPLSDW